jgi:hypothetical protein
LIESCKECGKWNCGDCDNKKEICENCNNWTCNNCVEDRQKCINCFDTIKCCDNIYKISCKTYQHEFGYGECCKKIYDNVCRKGCLNSSCDKCDKLCLECNTLCSKYIQHNCRTCNVKCIICNECHYEKYRKYVYSCNKCIGECNICDKQSPTSCDYKCCECGHIYIICGDCDDGADLHCIDCDIILHKYIILSNLNNTNIFN